MSIGKRGSIEASEQFILSHHQLDNLRRTARCQVQYYRSARDNDKEVAIFVGFNWVYLDLKSNKFEDS